MSAYGEDGEARERGLDLRRGDSRGSLPIAGGVGVLLKAALPGLGLRKGGFLISCRLRVICRGIGDLDDSMGV